MAYEVKWYPFDVHPESDSCWSVSTGPDGRIYAAACCEYKPGGIVKPVRYNRRTDTVEALFDMDQVTDDPHDSGRATQCKIHYSFAPSMSDGVLYMATHLSGPPIDMPAYSPWYFWNVPERCFRGAALAAFDTRSDQVLWWDTLIPKEGCRCLAHDEPRRLLYALSYPRDHLFVYDLASRTRRDLGRIGSVNAQALFLDNHHRVWTTSDDGRLIRYDPQTGRMETSPYALPHNPRIQTGWHSVFYDAVRDPNLDETCIYATTWIANPYLMRIWPERGEWGEVEDLGPATQGRDTTMPYSTGLDHCGGLVFGGDGQLYYVASRWKDPVHQPAYAGRDDKEGVVWRTDPATLARTEVAVLARPDAPAHYVSRGAVDASGDLFFGHCIGPRPVGMFKVAVPPDRKKPDAHLPIRMWG